MAIKSSIKTLLFTFALAIFTFVSSQAAILTVTNTNDDGPGSLRQTIANADPNDDIIFDVSIAGETILLTSGEILIDKSLTITGPTPDLITITAANESRIFNAEFVPALINIEISNIIFFQGRVLCIGCNAVGGAVRVGVGANINFTDCSFIDNEVDCNGSNEFCSSQGGAVGIAPSQLINGANFTRCTFFENNASCSFECTAQGGAFSNTPRASNVSIRNSTFYQNSAFCFGSICVAQGGAIAELGTNTVINNTTFSDNSVLCVQGGCTQRGSTISNPETRLRVSNTIIQNNEDVDSPNCILPIFFDDGNNIQFPGNSCGAGIETANALLGPLQDNGGFTQTMAITRDSPAFNEGNNATCESIDQRFVVRPQFEICDIGAYELEDIQRNVPTLSEWGLIAMAAFLGIVGLIVARRRQLQV